MPILTLPTNTPSTPTPQQQLQAAVNVALGMLAVHLGQQKGSTPGLVPTIKQLAALVYACPIPNGTPGQTFGPQDVYACLGTGAATIVLIRDQLVPVVAELFPLFGLTAPTFQIPPAGITETSNADGTVAVVGRTPLQIAQAALASTQTVLATAQSGYDSAKSAQDEAQAELTKSYAKTNADTEALILAQAQLALAKKANDTEKTTTLTQQVDALIQAIGDKNNGDTKADIVAEAALENAKAAFATAQETLASAQDALATAQQAVDDAYAVWQ